MERYGQTRYLYCIQRMEYANQVVFWKFYRSAVHGIMLYLIYFWWKNSKLHIAWNPSIYSQKKKTISQRQTGNWYYGKPLFLKNCRHLILHLLNHFRPFQYVFFWNSSHLQPWTCSFYLSHNRISYLLSITLESTPISLKGSPPFLSGIKECIHMYAKTNRNLRTKQ